MFTPKIIVDMITVSFGNINNIYCIGNQKTKRTHDHFAQHSDIASFLDLSDVHYSTDFNDLAKTTLL
jgi:hypothetical protein